MRKQIAMLTPLILLKHLTQLGLLLMLGTSVAGCATTVGQEFRDIMADIDADCKREGLGPYLDTSKPQPLSKITNTRCEILRVKAADPLATEEGRFAYSIKLPESHDKLKTEYSRMMTAESYFKELCEKDAGEWIFKTVEGVEGVFQGRQDIPESQTGDSLLVFQLREAIEIHRAMEDDLVQPYQGRFNFMERPLDVKESGKSYARFYRGTEVIGHYKVGTQKNKKPVRVSYIVNMEQTDTLKSRYAFTWRQVASDVMIENGIVGGETIVYDRTTKEVLAFRRFFYRYWPRTDSRYSRLANHDFCRPRFADAPFQFIQKVLIPINPAE